MTTTKSKNEFDELHRKVSTTARTRFCAARRLEASHRWAQATIAIASVALIVIPLIQAVGIPSAASPIVLNAFEVILATSILAFSLLLNAETYQLRADRMHRCGVELGRIYRRLEPYRKEPGIRAKYNSFCSEYDAVLDRYENHSPIDYLEFTLTRPTEHYAKWYTRYWALIRWHAWSAVSRWPFLLVLAWCIGLTVYTVAP